MTGFPQVNGELATLVLLLPSREYLVLKMFLRVCVSAATSMKTNECQQSNVGLVVIHVGKVAFENPSPLVFVGIHAI